MSKKDSSFSIKIIKVILGFIVSYLFLLLMLGGFNNVNILLMYSVICTAGVGLVIWILLWYGVGSVVYWIISSVFTEPEKPAEKGKANHDLLQAKDKLAIISYINSARSNHIKDEAIESMLKLNGWSDTAIKEGFKHVVHKKD